MTTINFNLAKQTHTADVRVLVTRCYNGDGDLVTECRCIINSIDGKPLHQIEGETNDIVQYYALSHAARAKAISEYKRVAKL